MKVASLSKCVIELEFQLLILDSDAVLNLRLEFCCTGSPVELSHEQWCSWLKKSSRWRGAPRLEGANFLEGFSGPPEKIWNIEPRKWHFLRFRGWKDVTKQSFNTPLTGVFSLRKIQKMPSGSEKCCARPVWAQRSAVLGKNIALCTESAAQRIINHCTLYNVSSTAYNAKSTSYVSSTAFIIKCLKHRV
jgi:hypothetical protein